MATETCTIERCEDRIHVRSRGWCVKHYTRWHRYGDPLTRIPGEVVDGKKICRRCGIDKPVSEFSRSNDPCRSCVNARMRARRLVSPDYVPVIRTPKNCDCCGAEFMADGRRNRYCSRECFRAYKHKANWVHLNRRRAMMRGVESVPFDRMDVFIRDGWICQLCGNPILRCLQYPDPESPSLDHVVPIIRGGAHRIENAQASHFLCNMLKGSQLLQRLSA